MCCEDPYLLEKLVKDNDLNIVVLTQDGNNSFSVTF